MADEKKTDKGKITKVVFTPTGKARACPDNDREWVQPLGTSGFVQDPVCIHGDIYTRKDFYAPEESEGQAEPPTVDLREMAGRLSGTKDWRAFQNAIIDSLEAQRRDIGALERWVKGFETP